ncbi:conserved hypothetical protein [Candidatus Phytoplasma solani]|nr:conserved hypothetical protein [Candidatus Phytoplasma solani]
MNIARICIVSKKKQHTNNMIRVNATKLGKVAIDLDQKLQGRGAYLSFNQKYIQLAQKKRLLDKKLKTRVPETIYSELLKLVRSTPIKKPILYNN